VNLEKEIKICADVQLIEIIMIAKCDRKINKI
jgi:hypothetical protein